MKDSVTSGLPSKWPIVGGECSGSSGQPMLLEMDESKIYAHASEDIVIEKKMALAANKTKEKGGFVDGFHGNVGMGVEGLLGPY